MFRIVSFIKNVDQTLMSHQINEGLNVSKLQLINKKTEINITDAPVGVFLCQLKNEWLKDPTKKEQQWIKIKSILTNITKSSHEFGFVVFPEVTLPHKYANSFVKYIDKSLPAETVTIVGLEPMLSKDCKKLIKNISAITEQSVRNIPEDRYVNPCLILCKSNKSITAYLQLKVAPSKFESDLLVMKKTGGHNTGFFARPRPFCRFTSSSFRTPPCAPRSPHPTCEPWR